MPPRSPLPPQSGLDAARLRTPDRVGDTGALWSTMGQWLRVRLPAKVPVEAMIGEGRFVYADGVVLKDADPYRPRTFVWFQRETPQEVEVPGQIHVVYRDERIVVVDKPAFLATMPRGRHVRQSVVVRLRDELGLPELAPMHRLDRVTSGLLALTIERRWRGAYQSLFDRGAVQKTYWALAPLSPLLDLPVVVRNHVSKLRGQWQAQVIPDLPGNAETLVELGGALGDHGRYRLTPRTGRTHQLRVHMSQLGIPIVGDPLYPQIVDVAVDDFTKPLQLLAGALAFVDPLDGTTHRWRSVRSLPLLPENGENRR